MTTPNPLLYVALCTGCNNWQIDVTRDAMREMDRVEAFKAIATEHVAHQETCVNPDGRVKVLGQWVERPKMMTGRQATGVLAFTPLPRWWVIA